MYNKYIKMFFKFITESLHTLNDLFIFVKMYLKYT